jgi:hypothetical protein
MRTLVGDLSAFDDPGKIASASIVVKAGGIDSSSQIVRLDVAYFKIS